MSETPQDPTDDSFDHLLRHAFAADADRAGQRQGAVPPAPNGLLGGRYRLQDEIGSGGVGVVHRAIDTALNREVALKILQDRHQERAGLTQRFLEEAQVAAQLEHPGIVPVHDVGVAADGRPFFVMKLLAGRTLLQILRDDPERDGLLDGFEQVCRAVACAHDAGVVHRDLKPSNIVVGARGEAQVVDWGLAKVLGEERAEPIADAATRRPVETVRSGSSVVSQTGSVFGTPAYMPPEQAHGRIEDIGPATDVFSLGAILVEILTDRPIYEGTREEAFDQAKRCAVQPALARLAEVCDDRSLVALIRSALAVDPAARPATAGDVAEAVAKTRRDAVRRARDAELRATASEARVASERRARRWQVGTLAAVALLILGAGGVVWGVDASQRAEAAETARAVDDALSRLPSLSEPDPLHVITDADAERAWRDAEKVLVEARALVASGRADPQTVARIEAADRRLADVIRAWRDYDARRARDARFVARFEAITIQWMNGWDHATADRRFGELFAAHLSTPPTDAELEDARTSSIRAEFVRALDTWWFVRRNARSEPDPVGVEITASAQAIDPDPDRRDLRAAIRSGANADPNALAAPFLGRDLDPATAVMVGRLLKRTDRADAAREVLLRAVSAEPGDFLLNMLLHWQADAAGDGAGAIRFANAAVVARPGSVVGWNQLGTALGQQGRFAEAARAFERAVALDPGLPLVWANLAMTQRAMGELDPAAAAFRRAIALDPASWGLVDALADVLESSGNGVELEALLEGAGDDWPVRARRKMAWRRYYDGQYAAARKLCSTALAALHAREEAAPSMACELHFLTALAAEDGGDRDGAIAAYQLAIQHLPNHPGSLYNLGLLLGDEVATRPQAIDVLRRAAQADLQSARVRFDLVRLLQQEAGPDAAEECLELLQQVVVLPADRLEEKDRAIAWDEISRHAHQLGRGALRLEASERLAALRPDEWRMHARVAQAHELDGDLDGAERAMRRAARVEPQRAEISAEIARLRYGLKRFVEGEAEARHALELSSANAHAHYWLGRCLFEQHRLQEALPAFERAAQFGSESEDWDVPPAEWIERCRRSGR